MNHVGNSPPEIHSVGLPREARVGAWAINVMLDNLEGYVRDFRAAVALYDHSLALWKKDGTMESEQMFAQWPMLAARDGAMSIYHFGIVMEGIKKTLPSYPAIYGGVDKAQLRAATNLFRQHFPRPERIRNVVAHSAEEAKNLIVQATVSGKIGFIMFNNMVGRHFTTTYGETTVSYELAETTVHNLDLVKSSFYESFSGLARPPPLCS
jgi:hypothetical protein